MTERLARLTELQKDIQSAYGMWGTDELRDGCAAAAAVPDPGGRPDSLRSLAGCNAKAAQQVTEAYHVVEALVAKDFSGVWAGVTHVAANQALRAVADDLARTGDVLRRLAGLLEAHADVLQPALRGDRIGATLLGEAAEQAGAMSLGPIPDPSSYDGAAMRQVHQSAVAAVGYRVTYHEQVRDSGHQLTSTAYDLASWATAAKLAATGLSGLDVVVLGQAGLEGGEGTGILTAAMATRAKDAWATLSLDDLATMKGLLAQARSPEHRAYLMKTLGAGYSVAEVARFDALIADHADDPDWLRERLSPLTDPDGRVDFQGAQWTQGNHPTCVASSTVAARAQVDPLYALGLTTGGHPGDPAHDNPAAFAERLRTEQQSVYDGGRGWLDEINPFDTGMDWQQSRTVADEQIAAHTGVRYEVVEMEDTSARTSLLGDIERAVDEGYPVPLSTRDDKGGHQMMIIGHSGDQLQIYNPWGTTTWISEAEFVSGQMDKIHVDVPDNPRAVRMPQLPAR